MQAGRNAEIWIPSLDSTLIAHIYKYCSWSLPTTGNVRLLLLTFSFSPCVTRRPLFNPSPANATSPQSSGQQEDNAVFVVKDQGRRSRQIRLLYMSYSSQGQSAQSCAASLLMQPASQQKCDEKRMGEDGPCETCYRLKLECLGFGAKRPDWLRVRAFATGFSTSPHMRHLFDRNRPASRKFATKSRTIWPLKE